MIKVTVWSEYSHENPDYEHYKEKAGAVHPKGLHETVADIVRELGDEVEVRTAHLWQEEQGLSQALLDDTDVMIWWGHALHHKVEDEAVERVYQRVLDGMGLIVLHSGHHSKIFRKLNGTTCNLKWVDSTYERIFNINPAHPIAAGIPEQFELGLEECYGEQFDIATPDELLFLGWFDIGEVFRSGATWHRGYGKIFYFQPGHETNQAFFNPYYRRIVQNAVKWAYNENRRPYTDAPQIITTLEDIRKGAEGEYLRHR